MGSVVRLVCLLLAVQCVAGARMIKLPSSRRTPSERSAVTTRPLVGILSQPGDGMEYSLTSDWSAVGDETGDKPFPPNYTTSYIAASYVKFVEASGGRVVPLIYNEPEHILREKFAAINGILFPGGGSSLAADSPFYITAKKLFNWAVEANDRGDYFPVYGVCLGFQLLSVFVTENHKILEPFEAKNLPGPLHFVNEGAKSHGLFDWVPLKILDELDNRKLAMQNHKWGLSPETWYSTPKLNDFFEVLTVTPDRNNKLYVSTVEAREYPILGVQWHPEKNTYEWGLDMIPHSEDAIQVTQSVGNYFIAEARMCSHKPTSHKQEEALLIYNYDPVYTSKAGRGTFDQAYVFEL